MNFIVCGILIMSFPLQGSEYRSRNSIVMDAYSGPPELFDQSASQPGTLYSNRGKRLFDIVVASLMLLASATLMLVLMGIVAIGGGNPLYAHPRVGRAERIFGCLKFRSMRVGAAEILATDPVAAAEWEADHKLTDDPRVTSIGGFLRKSSLDELPQLICVLRGEMSLVGPAPDYRGGAASLRSRPIGLSVVAPGTDGALADRWTQ